MTNDVDGYRAPQTDAERARVGELIAGCFGFPVADVPAWFEQAGVENVRAFHEHGELIGGLLHIPMGQFWGGRSVRMAGVGGVGIAPTARGSGAAARMMTALLREQRRLGFPLSGLYPATQVLYRRVGYEQAGARYELKGPVSALPRLREKAPMRAFRPEDLPAVQRLYTDQARNRPGFLDRGRYAWSRLQTFRSQKTSGYVVEEGGQVTGYLFALHTRKPNLHLDLTLIDWNAATPAAWRRLVTFLADHSSMVENVTWYGGDTDPVLLLLEEQRFEAKVSFWWMLRVLDVPAALAARGYPALPPTELNLEVSDPLFPENNGRFVLATSGREGRVQQGGTGALRCDVRALATLYSGHRSAAQLAQVGLIQATPEAIEAADALFAGPTPACVDMY